jgi:hypothetical protein
MQAVPEPPPPGTGAAGQGSARPRLLRERVVGIIVTRGSVFPVNELDKGPTMMASPRCSTGWAYGTSASPERTSSCSREPPRRRSGAGHSR